MYSTNIFKHFIHARNCASSWGCNTVGLRTETISALTVSSAPSLSAILSLFFLTNLWSGAGSR